jgi:hypothetical protein
MPAVAQRDQRDDFIDELAHLLSPSPLIYRSQPSTDPLELAIRGPITGQK